MSDTATNGSLDGFLLDGDAPRLGVAGPTQPERSLLDYETLATEPTAATGNAAGDPFSLPAPRLDAEPVLVALAGPSLPAPTIVTTPAATDETKQSDDPAQHPMAHLMPAKSKPTEASIRAAQARAAKKSKARKLKIIAGAVFLAFAILVGPPLGKWLVNAINESGKLSSDEPAATVPATTEAGPLTTEPAGATGLAGLPGDATAVVDEVNGAATAASVPATAATTIAP